MNEKMDAIIAAVRQFNVEGGVGGMVTFETQGERKLKGGRRQHKWEDWREFHTQDPAERDYRDFLHLTDKVRVKMHMKLIRYFFHQTSFLGEQSGTVGDEVAVVTRAADDTSEPDDTVLATPPETRQQQDTETSGAVGVTDTFPPVEQGADLLDESMESICESIERKCTGQEIGTDLPPENNLILLDEPDTECD